MKDIPAFVQPAPIDPELIAEQVIVALNEERSIDSNIKNLEGRLEDARGTKRMRRIEVGTLLNKVRTLWPERGPTAKGWSQFLAHVRLDDSTAWRYMDEAKNPERAEGFSQKSESNDPESQGSGSAVRETAQRVEAGADAGERKPANVFGGSKDPARGTYCTPKKWAEAIGPWDLDPFSNPRSHILAADHLSIERGDDGLLDLAAPGSFYRAPRTVDEKKIALFNREAFMSIATASTRTFWQPPYELVAECIAHYGHTRFCALLRFDTSTEWFRRLWALTTVVCFPLERLDFEPPPGIESSANPFPHAFFYSHEADITDEIRSLCLVWRIEHPKGGDVSLDQPA